MTMTAQRLLLDVRGGSSSTRREGTTRQQQAMGCVALLFLSAVVAVSLSGGGSLLSSASGASSRASSASSSFLSRSAAGSLPKLSGRVLARCQAPVNIGRRRVASEGVSKVKQMAVLLGATAAQLAVNPKGWAKSRSEVSLLSADPINDPKEILRRALPVSSPGLDAVQSKLYQMSKLFGGSSAVLGRDSNTMRGTTGIESSKDPKINDIGELKTLARAAKRSLDTNMPEIQAMSDGLDSKKKARIVNSIGSLQQELINLVSLPDNPNPRSVYNMQQKALDLVGDIKENSIKAFPFQIPGELQSNEQLKGRATAEIRVRTKDEGGKPKTVTVEVVVDGYNAPITAGRFVNLAKSKFYDNMEIQRSDGFIVQTGQRPGVEMDTIPLEIMVDEQKTPIYGFTLEQISRFDERTKLPFNALGTLAMSRNVDDANSADTQFFWLLKNNDMTPSGTNLLDGRFAVFGYTTDNADALYDFKVGDVIESVKIVQGMENFAPPAAGGRQK